MAPTKAQIRENRSEWCCQKLVLYPESAVVLYLREFLLLLLVLAEMSGARTCAPFSAAAKAAEPVDSALVSKRVLLNLTAYTYAGTFVGFLRLRPIGMGLQELCVSTLIVLAVVGLR